MLITSELRLKSYTECVKGRKLQQLYMKSRNATYQRTYSSSSVSSKTKMVIWFHGIDHPVASFCWYVSKSSFVDKEGLWGFMLCMFQITCTHPRKPRSSILKPLLVIIDRRKYFQTLEKKNPEVQRSSEFLQTIAVFEQLYLFVCLFVCLFFNFLSAFLYLSGFLLLCSAWKQEEVGIRSFSVKKQSEKN